MSTTDLGFHVLLKRPDLHVRESQPGFFGGFSPGQPDCIHDRVDSRMKRFDHNVGSSI